MIKPDRHTNLDTSILNISASILVEFKGNSLITYDSLLKRMTKALGEDIKELFPYSLSFLFLLGKIEYHKESDSIIYNEA